MASELAELTRTLADLVTLLSGGVQATTRDGARASDVFVPFRNSTTITGTTALDVWTPQTGRRFVVRGGYVVAVVKTVLAAANAGTLELIDSGTGNVVCPLGAFSGTAAADTVIAGSGLRLDLVEGVNGSVVGAKVQIKPSLGIGSGVIAVSGVLWGTEVTG